MMAEFNPEWLYRIPPVPANPAWTTAGNAERFFAMTAALPGNLRASAYWTLRIGEEIDAYVAGRRQRSLPPGFEYAAVGFLNPEVDGMKPGFGAVLYTTIEPNQLRVPWDQISVGWTVPIVQRTIAVEEHGATSKSAASSGGVSVTSPSMASVACWAHSRVKDPVPYEGWLTARHALGKYKTPVYFSDGGQGKIIDQVSPCIDAALVSTSQRHLKGSKLTVTPAVGGLKVEFPQRTGGTISTNIWDIASTFGQTGSGLFPVRFAMDKCGVNGDSGALISSTSGDIVGVYLGTYQSTSSTVVAHPIGGFGISAENLKSMMEMEFYS